MNDEVYKEVYGHILNDAQRIRKEIMNEWGDILMFGGTMPKEVVDELSTAARITGLSFDALSNHGVPCTQVDGKPDLYRLTVREESYVCHKTAIPSMSGFLDVVNIPGVAMPEPTPKQELKQEPKPQPQPKVEEKSYSEPKKYDEEFKEAPKYEPVEEPRYEEPDIEQEVEESNYRNPKEDDHSGDEVYEVKEFRRPLPGKIFTGEVVEKAIKNSDKYEASENKEEDDDFDDVDSPVEEEPAWKDEAEEESASTGLFDRAADQGQPQIGSFFKSDIFIEEKEKHVDDIVYTMFGATLTHSGFSGGGKSLDIQIMIAPLKIQKFSCPSVPIIVSVYYKGKILTSSSYDQAEEGKNLVVINIDEFYLLFRGSYDGDGNFVAFVTTTGISASQGDILNITSEERFGTEAGRNVNNGHIKFRAIVYDDNGTIEAFPFGYPEDNEFIVMTKTDEFVDYMYLSDDVGGLKKAVIYQEGRKVQVKCSWNDDVMSVDLVEV